MQNRLIAKVIIGVSIILLVGSCNTSENSASIGNVNDKTNGSNFLPHDSIYPEIIVNQGLEAQYNEAKWNLYLYASIDTPKDTDGQPAFEFSKPYAAYPVIFDTLYKNNDTLIFYFNFYIEDSILTHERIFNLHLSDVPTAVNIYEAKRCVYFKGKTGFDYNWICAELDPKKNPQDISKVDTNTFKSIAGRLYFPINPLVVEYIVANQKELNPWFVNQAKKRKIIR